MTTFFIGFGTAPITLLPESITCFTALLFTVVSNIVFPSLIILEIINLVVGFEDLNTLPFITSKSSCSLN